ncbi:MAG: hypothetical protein ACFB2Z_08755 [Maricaulaceae bacterium]
MRTTLKSIALLSAIGLAGASLAQTPPSEAAEPEFRLSAPSVVDEDTGEIRGDAAVSPNVSGFRFSTGLSSVFTDPDVAETDPTTPTVFQDGGQGAITVSEDVLGPPLETLDPDQ